MAQTIFQYADSRSYLRDYFLERKSRNPKFSLRAWSRHLGFKTPSLISSILQGKRPVTFHMARKLGQAMALSPEEKTFFELLALKETSPGESEREMVSLSLQVLSTRHRRRKVSLREMNVLSEWYAIAILEMFDLENFKVSSYEISNRLGKKVPPTRVRSTLSKLLRLGLLSQDSEGRWSRNYTDAMAGDETVPAPWIRNRHKKMTEMAMECMENDSMEIRDMRGSTFAIREEDYTKAVEIIKEFHSRIRGLTKAGQCDKVYHVGTQFFPLTQPVS